LDIQNRKPVLWLSEPDHNEWSKYIPDKRPVAKPKPRRLSSSVTNPIIPETDKEKYIGDYERRKASSQLLKKAFQNQPPVDPSTLQNLNKTLRKKYLSESESGKMYGVDYCGEILAKKTNTKKEEQIRKTNQERQRYWRNVRAIAEDRLLDTIGWRNTIAATLHLKQSHAGTEPGSWVKLIDEKTGITHNAAGALKNFLRRVNEDCYKHAYRRYGKQVRIIPVIEKDDRYHYQIAIEPPQFMTTETFMSVIENNWKKMDWGNGCWLKPVNNPKAWNEYILKLKQKQNYIEAIDWENLHNPMLAA